MPDGFSQLADAVGEGQSLTEVLERVNFLQVVLFHEFPTASEFVHPLRKLGFTHRRDSSHAILTLHGSQVGRHMLLLVMAGAENRNFKGRCPYWAKIAPRLGPCQ